MNRIIITGTKGYLANGLKNHIDRRYGSDHTSELLSVRGDSWKECSFEGARCIIHAAALVHAENKGYCIEDYRRINTQLTLELAEKARKDGVGQFIYISSMDVYGIRGSCFKETVISRDTECRPGSKYGLSKYEAEQELIRMASGSFVISIIRSPFIYGKNCPGNYQVLRKLTLKFGVVPLINNRKSMIYIENLCEFLYRIYEMELGGVFMPQNREIVSTTAMAALIAEYNGKRVLVSKAIAPIIKSMSLFVPKIRKAFGNLAYDPSLSDDVPFKYNLTGFRDSMEITEKP